MATIRKTITLSDHQDDWIKAQIKRGNYTNESEYIRDLVRRDQRRQMMLSNLKDEIAAGLNSGISDASLAELWHAAEARSSAADA